MNFDHMTSVPMSFEYATFSLALDFKWLIVLASVFYAILFGAIFWTRCLRACWAALLELALMQKLTKGF
ncbi:hypothetical protein T08_11851 [Trichinella sp. T8]|nr:hypothetical protein T08_11851 [Trichinella sp. T8]